MPVHYAAIIKRVMYEKWLCPTDIPNRTRKQGVRGYGLNRCENCNNTWSTYRAHVGIDLKRQKVYKIYIQLCKNGCEQESVPSFRKGEFTEMVKQAIKQEKFFRNSNEWDVVDDVGCRGPPDQPQHESDLCERCGFGEGRNCWERYMY